MQFSPRIIRNQQSGERARIWLPDPAYGTSIRAGDTYADIRVDGEKRVAFANVISLIDTFTREHAIRMALGHDCTVFAMACESGTKFNGETFFQPKGKKVAIDRRELIAEAPAQSEDLHCDGILLTLANDANQPLEHAISPHMLVRATADDKEPLFASKLGASNPVVLSTLSEGLKLYPWRTLWQVSGLNPVDF